MVLFNYTTKELTAKVVYYGPGLCGKTTNLQFIYDGLPAHVKKGKMLSLATKTDRTLFFDFLPIELGRIRGMRTRVQLYTVPGQVFYNSTRKLVLKGADGVVFVADSQQKMMESNIESHKNLEENLREIGLKLEEMPLVMQFNKRDLPHLASVEEMNTLINRHNAPFYEAVATTGIGVEDTLKAVTKLVLNLLAAKYQLGTPGEGKSARQETAAAPRIQVAGEAATPSAESAPGRSQSQNVPGGGLGDVLGFLSGEEAVRENPKAEAPASADHAATVSSRSEDLEILELEDEVTDDVSPAFATEPGRNALPDPGDLSDLLEEISEDTPEEILAGLGNPALERAIPVEVMRSASTPGKGPDRLGPLSHVASGAETARPGMPLETPGETIVEDPLGILSARSAETPQPRAIQVGAVTPGQQHQITVPLEMSVEGRRVRLQLRMTLMLSR